MERILKGNKHISHLFEIPELPDGSGSESDHELRAAEFEKLFKGLKNCSGFLNSKAAECPSFLNCGHSEDELFIYQTEFQQYISYNYKHSIIRD